MGLLLQTRDVATDLKNLPSTLTNWDQCMSKTYCKWPVIAAIIVASLIAISIIWCLARCLCCGMACCCSCLSCCDCFTPKSRRRGTRAAKFKDEYSQMPPAQYGGPAPMTYQHHGAPQFATFDVSSNKKIHDDSLPAMPSWETASTRRIEDHSSDNKTAQTDGVELDRLDSKTQRPLARGANGYSQVPNATRSPNPNNLYRHASPDYLHADTAYSRNHDADVGTQRLMNHNDHDSSFQDTPLSPAPTYHTNPQHPNSNHQSYSSDRFAAHTTSPSPRDYEYRNQYNASPSYQSRPEKYIPSISTRYEASDYHHQNSATSPIEMPYHYTTNNNHNNNSRSPPPQHNGYYNDYDDQTSNRPPSLLQIGRKPIRGSAREV